MSAAIEEVGSDHSHSDHGHDHDHDHDHAGHNHDTETSLDKIQSRAERKARKALLGMGLKRVPDINRVTLRRSKTVLLVVSQPDVYKSASSDCYIVFGEAKVEDTATQGLNAPFAPQAAPAQGGAEEDDDDVPALEAVEDEDENAPVDETGIDAREIEMVMSQCNCSRAKAVRVLREHNGDVVNAIMAASS